MLTGMIRWKKFWSEIKGKPNSISYLLAVDGLEVSVVHKPIRNLILRVSSPGGLVGVSAPMRISEDAIRSLVLQKIVWIRRQQVRLASKTPFPKPKLINDEDHYFLGQRYRLRIVDGKRSAGQIELCEKDFMDLYVQPSGGLAERDRLLQKWYRNQLALRIPPLIKKWEPVLGVKVSAWGIRKMKTRWGSCNTRVGRIWLNLELVKKPIHYLEYVVVHELVHLLERNHNARFYALMDRHFPQGKNFRKDLDASPMML